MGCPSGPCSSSIHRKPLFASFCPSPVQQFIYVTQKLASLLFNISQACSCEKMQVLSNAFIYKFPSWILSSFTFQVLLHVASPASCHQVRTFSSSYAPFFAVRQQTLSAISKCALALACRETHEMHTHAKVHMISAVPKGTWKAASLVAFCIWTCSYWWCLENRGKTCYKERTLFKVPYPAAPKLSLGSSKALPPPPSLGFAWSSLLSSWERSPCVLRRVFVNFQTFSDPF